MKPQGREFHTELDILLASQSTGFYLRQLTTVLTATLLLFGGCSSYFDHYTPSATQERASTGYQNVRLLKENKSEILLSAIYLNEVYPEYAGGFSHFLVAFYSRENNSTLFFDSNSTQRADDHILLLNGEGALFSEELDNDDLLLRLMPISSNSWNRYYYVRYKRPGGNPILALESGHRQLALITYQKAQQ
jgi:hypothetical protein